MIKKFIKRYIKLISKINERHYWPLFIFLSLYFVIPYSEFIITALVIFYFTKGEKLLRKVSGWFTKFLPEWVRLGGSLIFFLVMLDDTLAYFSIIAIAYWSNKQAKKLKKNDEL